MKTGIIYLVFYLYPRLMLIALGIALLELSLRALRIGRYHPEIATCPWSRVPKVIWDALTENRIHIFEILSQLRKPRPRSL